jgi:transketolase
VASLPAVLASPQPCYVRFVARPTSPAVVHHAPFALGQAEQLCPGGDVTLLSYGLLVSETAQAADLLAARGIAARVINLRTLAPLDAEAVLRAARETRLLVTIEDHLRIGGLASIVAELLVSERVSAPLLPLALPGRWFRPALLADVLRVEGFTPEALADRVAAALDQIHKGGRLV